MNDERQVRVNPEGVVDESAERMVPIRRLPDEATGTMLRDFLADQGVPANVASIQIPWLGGVETMHLGYWGRLEVLEHDAERARALLEDFYAARPDESDPGLQGDPDAAGEAPA